MKPLFDYYYSDPHFGHGKLLSTLRMGWGYDTADQMDEVLIDRYQSVVQPEDTVLWLGDVAFYGVGELARVQQMLARLPGRKILLRGNHDLRHGLNWWITAGFDVVMDGPLRFGLDGRTVVAAHMPPWGVPHVRGPDARHPEMRPVLRPGEVLLHGHTHSPRKRVDNRIHVGADAHDLFPVSHDRVLQLMQEIPR